MLSVLFAGDAAFDTAFTALATLATLAALTTTTLAARPANQSAPARALRPRGGCDHSDADDLLLLLAASDGRACKSGDGHSDQSKLSYKKAPFYVDRQGNTLQTREVTVGNAISKAVFNEKRNRFGDFAGEQPEIRTTFGPGTWRPDCCYKEMKEVVTSITDYELPLVAAMANDGTDIKQDEKTRFSIPVIKELLGQLSWFKQANMALALVKDAASKFMAGPPMVEARELELDDARWSALFRKAPPRFASLSTKAEASAKLPHNCSTKELTKFLRDHNEGDHLDQLGVPPESDQAVNEGRHAETEFDRLVAAQVERRRVAHTTKIFKSETDLQIPQKKSSLTKL